VTANLLRSVASLRGAAGAESSQVENSILLRVLVQLLVTLGIASVSIAASGVTQTSLWILMAIPLSALGAYFSWKRRRQRNITIKFFIAIGMLMALAGMVSRLLSEPGDTRILLAELLIQLQVLHSFDLPRRKDLGYSMIIGLILLGVAATISQTLAFGPLLLVFLAVSLPVLVLDYRSRLGLLAQSWDQGGLQLAPRRLGGVLVLSLALGLVIFLCLPRLPGYQIRNFPVSSTIDYQGNFNGQTIINPGYVSQGNEAGDQRGEGATGAIQQTGKLTGPGVVDNTSYYGFNQQMNQNLRGTMTPQVVMRVRSQAPGFWRVLAFDRYTGQGWDISRNETVITLKRSSFSYQMYLPWQGQRGRSREVIQTYTLVEDFPNLIPTLHQARELYFPTREVAIDPEGGLRSPVSLEKGMTYTVVSEVPYRDRTLLREAGTDYPESILRYYLEVPEGIRDRVRQHTEDLLAQSPNPLEDPYEISLYLAQTLKQRYSVDPDLPFFNQEDDLVEAFLFNYQGGYPDHFSTVLTIMLRSIGIPTRLVVGFGQGEFNPFTGFYIVRNTDAYAMPEVYFPDYGWFGFDPIPGHEVLPPSIRESDTFSAVRQFWNWIAGWLPSPVTAFIDGTIQLFTELLARLFIALARLFGQDWAAIILGFAGVTAAAFLGWIGWQGWRGGWRRWQLSRLPAMERLYQQLLNRLARQGLTKRPSETPLEFGQRLYQHTQAQPAQIANEISHAYVRWRYGGESPNLGYLQRQLRSLRFGTKRRVRG
jgi:transglutaminase-like putative cysteine protease